MRLAVPFGGMSLDELNEDLGNVYGNIDEDETVSLDRETRQQLAMLATAFGTDDIEDLISRGVRTLFRSTVDGGDLDFHLRSAYDVTYDEYLSGMTYDEMTGRDQYPERDDERRYQM
jgi:hypothetical protein